MTRRLAAGLALLAAAALTGCQSAVRLQPDFGNAVRQDIAAQIADPDAGRKARPAPPSDGVRTALTQDRYQKDQVTQPAAAATSKVGVSAGSGGGAGGGG